MSEPRSKADKEAGKLSETTKSYVHEWLTEQTFNLRKQLETKEIKKGLAMEDEAIDLLAEHHKAFYVKNENFYSDDFITGTPDIITDDKIIDIKCPWDCYTFPLYEEELNKVYYWQMQGYMYLTGKDKAIVAYCLMNTPIELAYTELDNVDYSEYPTSLRIKEYHVNKNKGVINEVINRVKQIRNYLNDLQP